MQHALRCWERQSDGTEYKEIFPAAGGAYSAPVTPLA